MTGCIDWIRKRSPPATYEGIEMTSDCGAPITYKLYRCRYNRRLKPNITQIDICSDRLVLTDNEFIKFEYIHKFVRVSPYIILLVCFGKMNSHGEFTAADNHIGVILSFEGGGASRFLEDTHRKILNYKKLNTYNKLVKEFRYFKL